MCARPLAMAAVIFTIGLLAVLAPSVAGERSDSRVASEVACLQGDWTLVSLKVNGFTPEANQNRPWVLVVEGDHYNPGSGDYSVEYNFRLDPSRTPKAIDLIPSEGPYHGRTLRGVYALEGDTFTVCRPIDPDSDRPAGLTGGRHGSGLTVSVWKRRKP